MGVLAIVGCSELLTMDGSDGLGAIANGAIRMDGDRIAAVGRHDEILNGLPEHAEVFHARGSLVTPGLIDAHTHLVFAGHRADEFAARCVGATYEQIAEQGGGILSTVAKTQAAGDVELQMLARKRLRWMLGHGTTTLEAKSGYGLEPDEELRALGILQALNEEGPQEIVPTFLGLHVPPKGVSAGEFLDLVLTATLPRVVARRRAVYADAFLDPAYFSEHEVLAFGARALSLGLKLRLHVDQLSDSSGAHLAASLGAATADHLEHTGPSGIAAMADAGVTPVLLPASVFALGKHRYPEARGMLQAKLPVVLATDFNPGSSPTVSLPFVMALACLHMKMTPREVWRAVTVNAAYSLGRHRDLGRLAPGFRADVVQWDASDHREVPYWLGEPLGKRVWIRGRLAKSR